MLKLLKFEMQSRVKVWAIATLIIVIVNLFCIFLTNNNINRSYAEADAMLFSWFNVGMTIAFIFLGISDLNSFFKNDTKYLLLSLPKKAYKLICAKIAALTLEITYFITIISCFGYWFYILSDVHVWEISGLILNYIFGYIVLLSALGLLNSLENIAIRNKIIKQVFVRTIDIIIVISMLFIFPQIYNYLIQLIQNMSLSISAILIDVLMIVYYFTISAALVLTSGYVLDKRANI